MAKQALTIDNLGDLDNGIARAICNKAIAAAIADLDDRGEDGKPRKVDIRLTLQRAYNGEIFGHVETKTAVPSYKTAGTRAHLRSASDD